MASSLFPATRWSLIAGLDDQHALPLLVEHYAEAVSIYLRRKFPTLAQSGTIDDLVQEVLIALLRQPAVLQRAEPGSGRFRYFLMRVAYNAARNARRGLVRQDWRLLADEAIADTPTERGLPVADAEIDRAWALSVLQGALTELRAWASQGRLEPEAVALLERNLLQGESIRDAAQALDLSLGTAHRRLAKARGLLREAVVERLRFAGETPASAEDRVYELLLDALAG